VDGYQVIRINHNAENPRYELVATVAGGILTAVIPQHPDGTFNYRIKACNSASCSEASDLRTIAVLKVPSNPSGLTGPASSNNGVISLSWTASTETVSKYDILAATPSGGVCPYGLGAYDVVDTSTSPRHDLLNHPDGSHCLRVRACNNSGCSPNASNTITVVVQKSLEGLPDSPVPNAPEPVSDAVGTLVGKSSNDGGRASYSVTIPVPPGRAGVTPGVSLEYSSGSSANTLGLGWSLSAGQAQVHRCAAIEAISVRSRPFNGHAIDRLCLNGQQLLLRSGSSAYGSSGSRYSPENDPFTIVTLMGGDSLNPSSYFHVRNRSGMVQLYDRQQRGERHDGTFDYPTRWHLTSAKTPDGNRIDYRYSNDVDAVLTSIFYTGFSSSVGNREVRFNYEASPHPVVGYTTQGFKTAAIKRLASIGTYVGASQVHHIKLRYELSAVSGRSLLKGVQLCKDSSCAALTSFPETLFTYSDQDQLFVERTITDRELDELVHLGDIDGDGRNDYALFRSLGPLDEPEAVEIRVSSEPQPIPASTWVDESLRLNATFNVMDDGRADFNSDGRDDLVSVKPDGEVVIGLWNVGARRIDEWRTGLYVDGFVSDVRDFDLDGDADLVVVSNQGATLYTNCSVDLNPRAGFECLEPYTLPGVSNARFSDKQITDINADGYPDLMIVSSGFGGALATYIRFGGLSQGRYVVGNAKHLQDDLGGPLKVNDGIVRQLDVNGDGLADFFKQSQTGNNTLWINTGGRFIDTAVTNIIAVNPYLATGLVVMDYDRDGRDDLLSPASVATDYCYSWYDGAAEPTHICTEGSSFEGFPNFEEGHRPELNRGVYNYDVVRFVQNGDGSYSITQDATLLTGVIHSTFVCDANDDGLADLCSKQRSEYIERPNNSTKPCDIFSGGVCLIEVSSHGGPKGTYAHVTTREQAFGFDVLTQAVNGLGMKEQWSYAPLSGEGDPDCSYTAAAPFYKVNLESASRGHYHFGATMPVVASYRASNGVGGLNEQCVRYEDAMFSTEGRGFQGFKAIVIDENLKDGHDRSTRTEYYDYFPLTGKPMGVQVRLRTDDPNGAPLSEVVSVWSSTSVDDVYHLYLETQVDVSYNADAPGRPTLTRSTTTNTYTASDLSMGNVTSQMHKLETFSDGNPSVTDMTTTSYVYDYGGVGSGLYDKVIKKTVTVSPTMYALEGPLPESASNPTKVVTEDYDYYNGTRRLESRTVQKGVATQEVKEEYEYDAYGNVERMTRSAPGMADRVVITGYGQSDGYFLGYTLSGGFNVIYAYNEAFGQIESQQNPDGTSVEFDYDFAGRLEVSRPNIGQPAYQTINWCESSCGNAVAEINTLSAGQPLTSKRVDVLGRVLEERKAGSEGVEDTMVHAAYDDRGRKLFESAPANNGVLYKTEYRDYDPLGRYRQRVVSRSGHAVGEQVWTYIYSGLTTTIGLPSGGLTVTRLLDAGQRLLSTRDAMGGVTFHRYDGQGNKVLTQNPQGVQVQWHYDALSRRVKTLDPDSGTVAAPAEQLVYNGFGEVVQTTNAMGQAVVTSYDTLGRPLQRTVHGVLDAKWIYDQNGKPSLSRQESGDSDLDGTADFVRNHDYDSFGRLIKSTTSIQGSPRTFSDKWAYDANYGRLKGREYASGEMVFYTFGVNGHLSGEWRPWSGANGGHTPYYTVNAYSARGGAQHIAYANGVEAIITAAESTGDLTGILYQRVQTRTALADLRYFYGDAFGNLTRRDDRVASASEQFTYDNLQRLDTATVTWTNGTPTRTVNYDYDAVGNLLEKSDFGRSYQYGDASRSGDSNAGPHAVRQVARTDGQVIRDFQYDAAGNMTVGNGRIVDYNVFNKPIKIREGAGVTEMRYGPDLSLTVRKQGARTTYYSDGYQLVTMGGTVQSERTYIGAHVVVEKAGGNRKVRYQHYDRLGSLVMVTDEQGGVTERHAFDAFGSPLKGDWQTNGGLLHRDTGSEQLTEKGYTGHEHLDTHQLIHMGGRIYDPSIGRFMSVDPFIQSETSTQSMNAYAYVMNNPLSNIDPSGYQCAGSCAAEDYSYAKQMHRYAQPQYQHTRSGADLISEFVEYTRTGLAEENRERQNSLVRSIALDGDPWLDTDGNWNQPGEVIAIVGTTPGSVWTMEERARAARHLRDMSAQSAWSINRHRQFHGDVIYNSWRPVFEIAYDVALTPVGMSAPGRLLMRVARSSALTQGSARLGAGRVGLTIGNEEAIWYGELAPRLDDTTDLITHGEAEHLLERTRYGWEEIEPERGARMLLNSGKHRPGNDIRLLACSTAAGRCAQRFSNATGERVWGATDDIQIFPDGSHYIHNSGRWVLHHPEGFAIGVHRIR
jgi:RHS repeat-associated protein